MLLLHQVWTTDRKTPNSGSTPNLERWWPSSSCDVNRFVFCGCAVPSYAHEFSALRIVTRPKSIGISLAQRSDLHALRQAICSWRAYLPLTTEACLFPHVLNRKGLRIGACGCEFLDSQFTVRYHCLCVRMPTTSFVGCDDLSQLPGLLLFLSSKRIRALSFVSSDSRRLSSVLCKPHVRNMNFQALNRRRRAMLALLGVANISTACGEMQMMLITARCGANRRVRKT